MNPGQRIKKVRQLLNKSQQDLANELNLTKQAISNIETGKCAANLSLLNKLLIDYNINLNYIIAGIGDIFLDSKNANDELRKSILLDVEKLLISRGIK